MMMTHRAYTIVLETLSLTITAVYLNGERVGTVEHFTTARRPKVWFAVDADGELVSDLGGFTSSDEAAFALVRRAIDQRLVDSVIAKLETPA